LFESSHSSSKERTVCMCVLERSSLNSRVNLIYPAQVRRPAAFVAVLTVLTQPEAVSSKSSSRRPRHRCQSRARESKTETKDKS
jgi:hypothetical protein